MRFQFSTPFRKETAACHGDADFLMVLNDGVLNTMYFTFYCVYYTNNDDQILVGTPKEQVEANVTFYQFEVGTAHQIPV